MRFCEQLNEYITRLDCRGKELADGAGLSAPTLSRYRTGERTPSRGSTALSALCAALSALAREKGVADMDEDTVQEAFLRCDEFAGADKRRENNDTVLWNSQYQGGQV